MSEQFPPTDAENPFDAGRTPRDPRAVKTLLAGVAGVAVIGGGALGFVWLGSAPGADASALGVTGGTVSVPQVTTSPSTTGDSAFAANGRDIFAATVAPSTAASAVETSGANNAAGVSTSSSTLNSVITFGSGSKSSSSSSSTKAPTNASGSSSSSPVTTSAPAPAATATPTAGVPWTAPNVRFAGASTDTADFWVRDEPTKVSRGTTIGLTTTVFDSYATVATTVVVEDINGVKTEKPSTDGYAVLRAGQGLLQGWMLKNPPGTDIVPVDLPGAAVGNTQGTIKVYEVGNYGPINGDGARISVNGAAPVYVKAKAQIPGTDFTYAPDAAAKAFATTTISKTRNDFAVLSDGSGRIYFGLIGAGEDAGIRY